MTKGEKRKEAPSETHGGQNKRKKVGNQGKWKTTHQESKTGSFRANQPQPGDVGLWVTCARNQESRAAREVTMLLEDYAQRLYGLESEPLAKVTGDEAAEDEDIEAAIKREVAALSTKGPEAEKRAIKVSRMDVSCLLFARTKSPINPVELAKRICQDARSPAGALQLKCRYVNRLTPALVSGKATEQGLFDVAKSVLEPYFDLSGKRGQTKTTAESENSTTLAPKAEVETPDLEKHTIIGEAATAQPADGFSYSFAIRPTLRSHDTLKRAAVIEQVASMINNDKHKVNLQSPDKVILVDIFKNMCSMSVVDGDWEQLKRYNLTELYAMANEDQGEAQSSPLQT